MFGVGWTEMLVIGVVALIVIGPKDLPVVMNRLGKVIANIRRLGGEFQREINKTTGLDQITDLRRSITEPLKSVANEITRDFNRVTSTGETVPSGAMVPKQAGAESVVAEIHEKAGMASPVAMTPLESPAPAEAMPPAHKAPRKPRAKKIVVAEGPVVEASGARKALEAKEAASVAKPARKPRTPKPKADA
jgi:sec-independent protein translocase protein TatB